MLDLATNYTTPADSRPSHDSEPLNATFLAPNALVFIGESSMRAINNVAQVRG
jgi:hypothetical protein